MLGIEKIAVNNTDTIIHGAYSTELEKRYQTYGYLIVVIIQCIIKSSKCNEGHIQQIGGWSK